MPNVLDLVGLGLTAVRVEDEDVEIGAATPLQDVADSAIVHSTTAGLLPAACRAAVPSRLLRGMATIGGEAVHDDPDSELAAALLALNAVFVVAHPLEPRESPALRFLRNPTPDLAGGGILRTVLIPGAPHGAALERAAALPSMPSLVAVAVTTTFSGDKLARVRLAITGLSGPPLRVMEAEAQLERTAGEEDVLEKAADLVCSHAAFPRRRLGVGGRPTADRAAPHAPRAAGRPRARPRCGGPWSGRGPGRSSRGGPRPPCPTSRRGGSS